jgi:hypothetical protein
MGVGHDGGTAGMFDHGIKVISKVCPDWCHAHGRAIPERPPTPEDATGLSLPRSATSKLRKQRVHGRPIPAAWVRSILFGKSMCQLVLVNLGRFAQSGDDGERHRGVVRPPPRGWTKRSFQVTEARRTVLPLKPEAGNEVTMMEKALPECISDRETLQRALRTHKTVLR